MKNQLPDLKILLNLTQTLKREYKGYNHQHLSFIRLFKKLSKLSQSIDNNLRANILFSACVYELLVIEGQSLFTRTGTLYALLTKNLGLTTSNTLSLDEKLIYLSDFYHFIQSYFDDDMLAGSYWQTKQHLLNTIKKCLLDILSYQAQDIKHLLEEPPGFHSLERKINELLSEYKQTLANRWLPNPERQAMLIFLEGIHETCYLHDPSQPMPATGNDFIHLQYDLIRQVRLGMILFSLMKFDYKILKSEPVQIWGITLFGSTFIEKALKTINITKLNKVNIETKINWLRALSMHIKSIKSHGHPIIEKWKQQGFVKLDDYETEIDTFLTEQELIYNRPNIIKQNISTLTSQAAQYGITFTLTQFAARAAIPSIETAIVGSVSGPVGVVIYSAAGTIIATQLTQLLKDKVIPAVLAGLYTKLLTKIGDAIGYTTTNMMTMTFDVTRQGLTNLLNFYGLVQTEEELKKDERWIAALLHLPDDIFSKDKKEIIRNTQDIPLELEENEYGKLVLT